VLFIAWYTEPVFKVRFVFLSLDDFVHFFPVAASSHVVDRFFGGSGRSFDVVASSIGSTTAPCLHQLGATRSSVSSCCFFDRARRRLLRSSTSSPYSRLSSIGSRCRPSRLDRVLLIALDRFAGLLVDWIESCVTGSFWFLSRLAQLGSTARSTQLGCLA
jgi:hypothetical protein